ncbi:MAG: class I SAM-dependent methyltransferase [Gaiellaceae bacterium]
MTEKGYDRSFYAESASAESGRSAARVIVPLIMERIAPHSVIDLGCGVGAWLKEFEWQGVGDYLGVDGSWVARDLLLIPADRFVETTLDRSLDLGKRFDLAVSLEVAEHLPERMAKQFVATIVRHAPCALFSAAIPYQGGTRHVNEQWPDYWAALFAAHGYEPVDAIRPLVWSDPRVASWYAQNILIFARPEVIAAHPLLAQERARTADSQLSLVHPRMMTAIAAHATKHVRRPTAREFSLRDLADAFPHALARSIRWRWQRVAARTGRRQQR